jgi:hypothetical protein
MFYWIVITLLVITTAIIFLETRRFELTNFVQTQAVSFRRGRDQVADRRMAWPNFAARAVQKFNGLAEGAKREGLSDLNVRQTSQPLGLNFISLYWGPHPTGIDWTSADGTALNVERGCALHFAQGPSGEVACIVNPFSSQLIVPVDKHYVYWIFRSPNGITDNALNDALRVMFAVAQRSSYAGNPTWADWYFYTKLHFFSFVMGLLHADWAKVAFSFLKKGIEKYIEEKEEKKDAKKGAGSGPSNDSQSDSRDVEV